MVKNKLVVYLMTAAVSPALAFAAVEKNEQTVPDSVIATQRANLEKNTQGQGFGPQAPRDIDNLSGQNNRIFQRAPHYSQMNLCNIHFHKNAEHKGGEFTQYAGNGNGKGYNTGFRYNGKLSAKELTPYETDLMDHPDLQSGDTIELHYVYSSADIVPAPTLGACLSPSTKNPQLRVEAQVFVLVNDENALDFTDLAEFEKINGYYQAPNMLINTGRPIEYAGSSTGAGYNEVGSPFQITWSVRPKVAKINIESVYKWYESNAFDEDHAHSVRNLVINPKLLSSGR